MHIHLNVTPLQGAGQSPVELNDAAQPAAVTLICHNIRGKLYSPHYFKL